MVIYVITVATPIWRWSRMCQVIRWRASLVIWNVQWHTVTFGCEHVVTLWCNINTCGAIYAYMIWKSSHFIYILRSLSKVFLINSSPPGTAYKLRWNWSSLVQIMACRLSGARPLSKPMFGYCQLDPSEQSSVKSQAKFEFLHAKKIIRNYRLQNGGHFVQGEMN